VTTYTWDCSQVCTDNTTPTKEKEKRTSVNSELSLSVQIRYAQRLATAKRFRNGVMQTYAPKLSVAQFVCELWTATGTYSFHTFFGDFVCSFLLLLACVVFSAFPLVSRTIEVEFGESLRNFQWF